MSGTFDGAPYNGGYPYDYEPPEYDAPWVPGIGDKARVIGDWSMAHLQVGEVIGFVDGQDESGAYRLYTIRMDDGSQDNYDFDDLCDPSIELDMPPDEEDEDYDE